MFSFLKFPDNKIYVGTGGLKNAKLIVENLKPHIDGLVYIYEPNLPNGKEFTWDFNGTLQNIQEFTSLCHEHNLIAIAKISGRPILQRNLQKYGWDYGKLVQNTDKLLVQTQTYLSKQNIEVYENGIDKLLAQFQLNNVPENPLFIQVAIGESLPNGVSSAKALDAITVVKSRHLEGLMIWWTPSEKEEFMKFIQNINKMI